MKLLTLTTLLGAAKRAHTAPSADLAPWGMFHQNGIDMVDQLSSVIASSPQQWKVGDLCEGGGVSVSDLSPSIHCADRYPLVSRDLCVGRFRRFL